MALRRTGRLALLLAGLSLAPVLLPAAAQAGATVAESIISKEDAINDAKQLMPAGAVVSQVDCIDMIRDLSSRYRCIVQWIPASKQ